MGEIAQDDTEDVQGTNENYESREVRGLRDGLNDEEQENMGRTQQQTRAMQSHLQQRKVTYANKEEPDVPRPIRNETKFHITISQSCTKEHTESQTISCNTHRKYSGLHTT